MATHSSILAWEILFTEEPGRLQPMGSQRFRHDRQCFIDIVSLTEKSTKFKKVLGFKEDYFMTKVICSCLCEE